MTATQLIGLLAALSLTAGSPLASKRSDPSPTVHWVDCAENVPVPIHQAYQQSNATLPAVLPATLKCGYLTVPLNYSKPLCEENSLNISFAFNDVNSTHGLLAYNPGGPGEEARSFAWGLAGIEAPHLDQVDGLEDFDFLAVDTRGTWSSSPLNCSQADWVIQLANPSSKEQYETLGENVQRFTADCNENTTPKGLLYHLGSDAIAQDFESLRIALNYDKLNYLGFSYGTFYAQEYLHRFPENAGHFVLDGVASYSQPSVNLVASQGRNFDRLVERADAWCQFNSSACPLSSLGNGSVPTTYKAVLEAASDPANNSSVSADEITGLTSLALFNGSPRFASFTGALALAATGNTSAFVYTPEFAAAYTQGGLTTAAPTLCTDLPLDDPSWEGYQALLAKVHEGDKYGGSNGIFYMLASLCASWPSRGSSDFQTYYTEVTENELLLVTADYDHNTPTEFTDVAKSFMPNATMIARHGDDHGSMTVPGPVRNAMLAYLYNGTIPEPTEQEIYSVYGPGQNRTAVVDPYVAPIGPVAGDVIE